MNRNSLAKFFKGNNYSIVEHKSNKMAFMDKAKSIKIHIMFNAIDKTYGIFVSDKRRNKNYSGFNKFGIVGVKEVKNELSNIL